MQEVFPVVWALQQGNAEELLLCRAVQLVSLCRLRVEPAHMWLIMQCGFLFGNVGVEV